MLSIEQLIDLSEEELDEIYQEKRKELDSKLFKNQRIRSMLKKKIG